MQNGTAARDPWHIVAVSGGLGTPSSSQLLIDRLIDQTRHGFSKRGAEITVTVIELRDLLVPIAHHLVTGFAEPRLAEALRAVRSADGLIAVTPVFNGSLAGHFKSFFDLLTPDDLAGLPTLLGATGGSSRHSLVIDFTLRPLFAYLRAQALPTGIFVATEDWGNAGTMSGSVDQRVARVAEELVSAVLAQGPAVSAPLGSTGDGAPGKSESGEATAQASQIDTEHRDFVALMRQYAVTSDIGGAP